MAERQTVATAHARADSAHQKIDDHEKLCVERYQGILATFTEIKGDIRTQHGLLWGILLAVAGSAMMSIVAIVLKAAHLS